MKIKSDAYCAGFEEGRKPQDGICVPIVPPEGYTDEQRGDFIIGFCAGANYARDQALFNELETRP